MRARPHARDLLEIARATYAETILPTVPREHRYTALMVANALANAEREVAAGEEPLRAELERLRSLYPEAPVTDESIPVQLVRLNRHLAAEIRKGRFEKDRALRERVRTHLLQTAIERVRETNPKYLEREGLA